MNDTFISNFVIGITLNKYDKIFTCFFQKEIEKFLFVRDIYNFDIVPFEEQISFSDFYRNEKIKFEYFYKYLLNTSRNGEKIEVKTKICISFDKVLCSKLCDKTNRYYNYISIGGVEKIYFLLFKLEEIYCFLYSEIQ
ncbi:hypothetical protein [uncultured Cardiobacterium sp.]|uniref:hypothetical protein n=1 Tax=uncultured Cardiobacterium sp. TaxID=417619 RepID=UPI0026148D12|nr:hypothetical protein [uncultured Cardiobacterium sp.]